MHRYAIVSDYIKDKIVLDIASGEGYGCNFMSKKAKFVYGVDIDDITVQEAKLKYKNKKIEFQGRPFLKHSISVFVLLSILC